MEDLGCAVVSQGIVVMREWKIKDAQWKVCDWTICMRSSVHSVCVSLNELSLLIFFPLGNETSKIRARRSTCGRHSYNPRLYMCCAGSIVFKSGISPSCCGRQGYDSRFRMCCAGNIVFKSGISPSCCGRQGYDSRFRMCCAGNIVFKSGISPSCCGRQGYDSRFRRCCAGQVRYRC